MGRIDGRAWRDANANGLIEPGEAGLSGAEVALLAGSARAAGLAGDDSALLTARTGPDGQYTFVNVAPGAYRVVQSGLPGFLFTTPYDVGITLTSPNLDAVVNFGQRPYHRVHLPLLLH
jgi:hypothetical protein